MALRIEGSVNRTLDLEFDDLRTSPEQVEDVSRLVPKRSGAAVPLRVLLDRAGVSDEARYITVTADDGTFSACVPLDAVAESAVVLYRSGDAPLPREKGGPYRFLIPDAVACRRAEVDTCANVKYVAKLTLSAEPGKDTRPSTPRDHKALHDTPGHEHLDED